MKLLVLQLLDRLIDRRLVDFGEMASYLLKTINLLMLRLLQYAPREATFCATRSRASPRRPGGRRSGSSPSCSSRLHKLTKTRARRTDDRAAAAHAASSRAPPRTLPASNAPMQLTEQALEAAKFAASLAEASTRCCASWWRTAARPPRRLPGGDATLGPSRTSSSATPSGRPRRLWTRRQTEPPTCRRRPLAAAAAKPALSHSPQRTPVPAPVPVAAAAAAAVSLARRPPSRARPTLRACSE